MTEALDDPRLSQGGDLALEAEALEREGDITGARERYARAAVLYYAAGVTLTDLPKLRAVIAVSAVCLAARGGRFDRAIEYAERFLAEPGSLAPDGVSELETLLENYHRALFNRPTAGASSTAPLDVLSKCRGNLRKHFSERKAA